MSDPLSIDTSAASLSRRTLVGCVSPYSPIIPQPSLSDSGDESPVESAIVTPEQSPYQAPQDTLGKHVWLNTFADMPAPNLGAHLLSTPRLNYPYNPAYKIKRDTSPPHTPKGHPIESSNFFDPRRMYPILNPYTTLQNPSRVSRFFRIPRRFRPMVLLGFCFLVFTLVYINHTLYLDLSAAEVAAYEERLVVQDTHWQGIGEDAIPRDEPIPQIPHHHQQQFNHGHGEPIKFQNTKEELVSLISFVTATAANSLPDLDFSRPLDPSVVLGFNPSDPEARDDLDWLIDHTNSIYPITLFGKMRDPWHREIQKILAGYRISPPPLIIDVDQRRDHSIFVPLLSRLFGTTRLPQLVVRGEVVGSYNDILDLRDAGTLADLLENKGGVSVAIAKKRKKGVKEFERLENERVLGPNPIVDM